MDIEHRKRLIVLKDRIVAYFDYEDWDNLAILTDADEYIQAHPRLLRSLGFGDDDYGSNVLDVLRHISSLDPSSLETVESYLAEHYPDAQDYISARPNSRPITFAPHVFDVPDFEVEQDLVAVMMPFALEFTTVHDAISAAAEMCGLKTLRADDVWDDTTIIQDIFNLIFRARVVVVDFSGKNPNVMYETGIAHTLGKDVIPITQSLDDVPFDMKHHRVLRYLANREGLTKLTSGLASKLSQFAPNKANTSASTLEEEDDIPL